MSVLDELVARARQRAAELPAGGPPVRCTRADFRTALAGKEQLSVIAEFKRQSPSQGGIAPDADLERQLRAYAAAGAAAISVLTEPSRFGGSTDDLRRAALAVDLPLLMKDFVVAPAQVRLAAETGASAVLLIVRCLEKDTLRDLCAACREHALTPLIECHDEREVELAIEHEDAVIGVNNRDLSTLEIDVRRAPELCRRIPPGRVAVAESGYRHAADVAELRFLCDAVLVGTALMQSADPAAFIAEVHG